MALTQRDIEQIEEIVVEAVREETKHLPTKNEFFGKMDEVMGELQKIRENTTVLDHRSTDHEDRIEKLEEIHPGGQHA